MTTTDRRLPMLGAVWAVGLTASGSAPADRATWWMEVAPVLIAFPALFVLRHKFRFSGLALALIALHGLVLMLGVAYTYARVPIWIRRAGLAGSRAQSL